MNWIRILGAVCFSILIQILVVPLDFDLPMRWGISISATGFYLITMNIIRPDKG